MKLLIGISPFLLFFLIVKVYSQPALMVDLKADEYYLVQSSYVSDLSSFISTFFDGIDYFNTYNNLNEMTLLNFNSTFIFYGSPVTQYRIFPPGLILFDSVLVPFTLKVSDNIPSVDYPTNYICCKIPFFETKNNQYDYLNLYF